MSTSSIDVQFKRRPAFAVLALISLFALAAIAASPASAVDITRHQLDGTFDGTGTEGPFSQPNSVAADEVSGAIYVSGHESEIPIYKFNAAGVPTNFSALGKNTIKQPGKNSDIDGETIAVDNSPTSTQGRIYLSHGFGDNKLYAFNPDGTAVGGNFPLAGGEVSGVTVDPRNGNLWVLLNNRPTEYTADGVPTGRKIEPEENHTIYSFLSSDAQGNVYGRTFRGLDKYSPDGVLLQNYDLPPNQFRVDPTNGVIYMPKDGGTTAIAPTGAILEQFGEPYGRAVGVNGAAAHTVYVINSSTGKVEIWGPKETVTLPDSTTGPGKEFDAPNATLTGLLNPDGEPTTDCYFEYGISLSYGSKVQCAEGKVFNGTADVPVSAPITGLTLGGVYHARLVGANVNGSLAGYDVQFTASRAPAIPQTFVDDVHTDSARLNALLNPQGATTTYHFEYGTEDCATPGACASTPDVTLEATTSDEAISFNLTGLDMDTTYYYRVVASNQSGTTTGPVHTVHTYLFVPTLEDNCANAHTRQQTGAAQLLDCRAYELVSAGKANGYDVQSDLIPGQTTYQGYPQALSPTRVLYSVHSGAFPGTGEPTGRGADPYVATRGEDGWTTKYVGIPASNPEAGGPFASDLLEADPTLGTFAFGGPDLCSPCFPDGSTNLPVRLPDGSLVEGIAGSEGSSPLEPSGYVGRSFSADGKHLVFGTETRLEEDGNEGSTSIYVRTLPGGPTELVSTQPDGATMDGGAEVGALDVSADGSRVVVAEQEDEDPLGNALWHPYLHLAGQAESVDLAPGLSSGAFFDGMTADGGTVFFTTYDQLVGEDEDESADVYEARVDSGGSLQLRLVSIGTGGTGNADDCEPPGAWNNAYEDLDCSALAFAGGAGLAESSGTFYFLSPELLDGPGNGTQDLPNLYLVRPGSPAPHFVATIDNTEKPAPPPFVHPRLTTDFAGPFVTPESIAIDENNGYVYVMDRGNGTIDRFDRDGNPVDYTAGSSAGSNQRSIGTPSARFSQIAVNNAPSSPMYGDVVYASSSVGFVDENGEYDGFVGLAGAFCGAAVDPTNGAIYLGDYYNKVYRFELKPGATAPYEYEDFEITALETEFHYKPCQLAADGQGHVFASDYEGGEIRRWSDSEFAPSYSEHNGRKWVEGVPSIPAMDIATADLYLDQTNRVAAYNSAGQQFQVFGEGEMANSLGIAVDSVTHHVFVSNDDGVTEFGAEPNPPRPIDNPAIRNAVEQPSTHTYGDFQVTAAGDFAAFNSVVPLTGADNDLHYEVFRYATAGEGKLDCASCNPTGARATGDSKLAADGLSLSDDGRVFFNSEGPVVSADNNGKKDAYEWNQGQVQLISSGTSPFDSGLLSIGADGVDAYFFTRDKLSKQDENGPTMKIYDARSGGGFAFTPDPVGCKASDECHGAGTAELTPPTIRTVTGNTGNTTKKACPKGKVKKKGKCVKKKPKKHKGKKHKKGEPPVNPRNLIMALVASAILALAAASPAFAIEPIESFETSASTQQAGGHPDLVTSFSLASPGEPESAKDVIFNAPEGVFGDSNAATQCTASEFAFTACPASSQVGLITLNASYEGDPEALLGTAPIYDLVPEASETARLAFIVPTLDIPIAIPVSVRTADDYGLRFTVQDITQKSPLKAAVLTFWGFPASPSHDSQRFAKGKAGSPATCPGIADTSCLTGPTPASIAVKPLIDNPTTCSGEKLVTSLDVVTYQDPTDSSHETSTYDEIEGCERLTFNPVLGAAPTSDETDSASGLDIELNTPQFEGLAASPSQLRAAEVTLPEGLTINPDAADGQTACLDSQANFDSEGPAECPDSAKIGTSAITSPTLSGPLRGSVYFGQPQPGNQYRLFLIASGFGINAKIVGTFHPDPQTGRLTANFDDLPQVPFDSFQLHLFASDRGLLATPTKCTVYGTRGVFHPWDAALPFQESERFFPLRTGPHGSSCPGDRRPFDPSLVAGTTNPIAGQFSSFTLKLDREDGDQFLGDLNFTMPPGLTGSLRGIDYCSEGQISASVANSGRAELERGSCPASSQIGTTNVAAGPGSHPFHAVGRMYLAGPFNGAPLSLVAVTPALAGPYDYGVVVVRVAVHVDPQDAHVIAVSDKVPSIIGGVPIRMRSIRVNIDRRNFMINPTNCSPFTVDSQGIGDEGKVADFSSPFHVSNCATLPFKPKMAVKLVGGRKASKRTVNPRLQFDLRTRDGDANIKSLAVTLPKAFEIDQSHLGNICSEKELAATDCAGRTPIGKATTTTPLLDQPLAGPVYAVSGSGGLPRLAFILDGQVDLVPRADTKTVKGKLKTTVPVVPDAPIGHFSLTVLGGKTGYLINTRDICKRAPVIAVDYVAQNGDALTQNVKLNVGCGKRKARPHRGTRR